MTHRICRGSKLLKLGPLGSFKYYLLGWLAIFRNKNKQARRRRIQHFKVFRYTFRNHVSLFQAAVKQSCSKPVSAKLTAVIGL